MPKETFTGRLNNDGPQVSIEDGPILAIRGPDPIATAARTFAPFGQSQPVTVVGTRGIVDNIRVLFVLPSDIHWARAAGVTADEVSVGGVASFTKTTESVRSRPIAKRKRAAKAKKKTVAKKPKKAPGKRR
jgi:hypothetical protein